MFCKKLSDYSNQKQTQTSIIKLCNTGTNVCFPIVIPEKTCNVEKPISDMCKIFEAINPNDSQPLAVIKDKSFIIKSSTESDQALLKLSQCFNEVTPFQTYSNSSYCLTNCEDILKDIKKEEKLNIRNQFENNKVKNDCNVNTLLDIELEKIKCNIPESSNVDQNLENKWTGPDNRSKDNETIECIEEHIQNCICPENKDGEKNDGTIEHKGTEKKFPENTCIENECHNSKQVKEQDILIEKVQEDNDFVKCPQNKYLEDKSLEGTTVEYKCPEYNCSEIPKYKCPKKENPTRTYVDHKDTDSKEAKERPTVFEHNQENHNLTSSGQETYCSYECPKNKCSEIIIIEYKCPKYNCPENIIPVYKCHKRESPDKTYPDNKYSESKEVTKNLAVLEQIQEKNIITSGQESHCSSKCEENKILKDVTIVEYKCPEYKCLENKILEFKCPKKESPNRTYLDQEYTDSVEANEKHTIFEQIQEKLNLITNRQETHFSNKCSEDIIIEYKCPEYNCPETKNPEYKCPEGERVERTYLDHEYTESKETKDRNAAFEQIQDNNGSSKFEIDIQQPPPIRDCKTNEELRKIINPYENLNAPHSSQESGPTKSCKLSHEEKSTSTISKKYPDDEFSFTVNEKECSEESDLLDHFNSTSSTLNIFKTAVQSYVGLVYEKTKDALYSIASIGSKQEKKSCIKPCLFEKKLNLDSNLETEIEDEAKETFYIIDDKSKLVPDTPYNNPLTIIEDKLNDIVVAKFDKSSKYDKPIQCLPESDDSCSNGFFGNIRSKFLSFLNENSNESDSDD